MTATYRRTIYPPAGCQLCGVGPAQPLFCEACASRILTEIGAWRLLPPNERRALASVLGVIPSPTLAAWAMGVPFEVERG